jgi:hypothetical protein
VPRTQNESHVRRAYERNVEPRKMQARATVGPAPAQRFGREATCSRRSKAKDSGTSVLWFPHTDVAVTHVHQHACALISPAGPLQRSPQVKDVLAVGGGVVDSGCTVDSTDTTRRH